MLQCQKCIILNCFTLKWGFICILKLLFPTYSADYFLTNLAFIYEPMFTRQSLQNKTIACDPHSPCVSKHSAKHGKTATVAQNDQNKEKKLLRNHNYSNDCNVSLTQCVQTHHFLPSAPEIGSISAVFSGPLSGDDRGLIFPKIEPTPETSVIFFAKKLGPNRLGRCALLPKIDFSAWYPVYFAGPAKRDTASAKREGGGGGDAGFLG